MTDPRVIEILETAADMIACGHPALGVVSAAMHRAGMPCSEPWACALFAEVHRVEYVVGAERFGSRDWFDPASRSARLREAARRLREQELARISEAT